MNLARIAVALWLCGMALGACTGGQQYYTSLTEESTHLAITLCADYNNTDTLENIWDGANTTAVLKLTIDGNGHTWSEFRYHYSYFTDTVLQLEPGKVNITNIRLITDTIDDYAVYSKYTQVYMDSVHIEGYSGNANDDDGGAIRIRATIYPDETSYAAPSFRNVTVHNCCRGVRIQDTTNFYCVGCHVENVTDNALYFASNDYTLTYGCINSTFADSSVKNAGQHGILMIGGSGNAVINTTVNGTRASAAAFFNSNGVNTLDNVTFTDANSAHSETPWGGNNDNFNGATVGVSIDCDGGPPPPPPGCASTIVLDGCVFNGGGVLTPGTIELWNDDNKAGGARNSGDGIAATEFANADTWANGTAAAPLSVITYVNAGSDEVNWVYTDNFYDGTQYVRAACAAGTAATQACTDTGMRNMDLTSRYGGTETQAENDTLALTVHQALLGAVVNSVEVTAAEVAAVAIAVVKTAATAQLTLSLAVAHVTDCKLDAMAKKAEEELKKSYDVVTVTCTGESCDAPQVCNAAAGAGRRRRNPVRTIELHGSSATSTDEDPVWVWVAVGAVSLALLTMIGVLTWGPRRDAYSPWYGYKR